MDLKKKIKGFFTLTRKGNGGFTLVELIVVIAILAILGGVAVPAYGGYVKKANKQADISLASEIEQALTLAMYNGELKEGATVVVKYGEAGDANVVLVDPDGDLGAAAALTAAFGSGWENLRLKYDGWDEEIGVAGNETTMGMVKVSNFNPDSLDTLLGQVQLVVGAASKALFGMQATDEVAALMNANDIPIKGGDTLDSINSMAAANAYVYLVGGELASLDYNDDDHTDAEDKFLTAWNTFDFSGTGNVIDPIAGSAAQYASIYALATYIDKETAKTGKGTDFALQMNNSTAPDPRDIAKAVLSDIKDSSDTSVKTAYNTYTTNMNLWRVDGMSFLAYMDGLNSSSDSLMENTDLNNSKYFVDGYVADYVTNYLDLSAVLTADGNSGSAFAFIFTGTDVRCMPLDW